MFERKASQDMKPGAVLFTRVVALDGAAVMFGCAPYLFAPSYLNELGDLRRSMTEHFGCIDTALLRRLDAEMREIYFALRARLLQPPTIELRNTDGEAIEYATLHYRLACTPREALEALAGLSLYEFDEVLADAEMDAAGNVTSVHIEWMKRGNKIHESWDNTILGHLNIDGDGLRVEVNSRQRAEAIKRKLTRRLGKRARLERTETQTVEQMRHLARENERSADESAEAIERRKDAEALRQRPEVQEMLREMAADHWQTWLDKPLPVLDGLTPRQAASSERGREQLDNLLLEFAWSDRPGETFSADIPSLRRELGLEP